MPWDGVVTIKGMAAARYCLSFSALNAFFEIISPLYAVIIFSGTGRADSA